MGMRKFSERLEWGRFYNSDTKEFLDDIFIEYTNPLDSSIDAGKTAQIKSGTNMMMFYTLEVPFKKDITIDKFLEFIKDLNVTIDRIRIQLPDVRHSIKMGDERIRLYLWSKE